MWLALDGWNDWLGKGCFILKTKYEPRRQCSPGLIYRMEIPKSVILLFAKRETPLCLETREKGRIRMQLKKLHRLLERKVKYIYDWHTESLLFFYLFQYIFRLSSSIGPYSNKSDGYFAHFKQVHEDLYHFFFQVSYPYPPSSLSRSAYRLLLLQPPSASNGLCSSIQGLNQLLLESSMSMVPGLQKWEFLQRAYFLPWSLRPLRDVERLFPQIVSYLRERVFLHMWNAWDTVEVL